MDLDKLRLPDSAQAVPKMNKIRKSLGQKLNQPTQNFVYIKQNRDDFYKAACLPGKVLHVYCAILETRTLKNSNTIELTTTWLKRYGVGVKAKKACLEQLEEAGLIVVINWGTENKKNPVVKIL